MNRSRLGALGTAIAAIVVLVGAGCGGARKMGPRETARWLEKNWVSPGIHVKCRPGSGDWSDWDYACRLSGDGVKGSPQENTYGYDVDSRRVTGYSG